MVMIDRNLALCHRFIKKRNKVPLQLLDFWKSCYNISTVYPIQDGGMQKKAPSLLVFPL